MIAFKQFWDPWTKFYFWKHFYFCNQNFESCVC